MEIESFNYFNETIGKNENQEATIKNFFVESFPWIEWVIEGKLELHFRIEEKNKYAVRYMIYNRMLFNYIEKYFTYELSDKTTNQIKNDLFDWIEKNIIQDIKNCRQKIFGKPSEEG